VPRQVDRANALEFLGLAPGANAEQIEKAYKNLSRPLKLRLLRSTDAGVKQHHRDALRELVCIRAAALGETPPSRWRTRDKLGISTTRLIAALDRASPELMDRVGARAWLQVGPQPDDEEILAAYELRSRALKRRYARSADGREMTLIIRARKKLRAVRDLALSEPEEKVPAGEARINFQELPPPDTDTELGFAETVAPASVAAAVEPAESPAPAAPAPEESATLEETLAPDPPPAPAGPPPNSTQLKGIEGLGLGPDASPDEVNAAYRRLSRPLRARMLVTEDEAERRACLDALGEIRRNRDLALG